MKRKVLLASCVPLVFFSHLIAANWLSYGGDPQRTGWSPHETDINSPARRKIAIMQALRGGFMRTSILSPAHLFPCSPALARFRRARPDARGPLLAGLSLRNAVQISIDLPQALQQQDQTRIIQAKAFLSHG